jgi:hypothetical protein
VERAREEEAPRAVARLGVEPERKTGDRWEAEPRRRSDDRAGVEPERGTGDRDEVERARSTEDWFERETTLSVVDCADVDPKRTIGDSGGRGERGAASVNAPMLSDCIDAVRLWGSAADREREESPEIEESPEKEDREARGASPDTRSGMILDAVTPNALADSSAGIRSSYDSEPRSAAAARCDEERRRRYCSKLKDTGDG